MTTEPSPSWHPSAHESHYGDVEYVVQATEDGYYGFAWRDSQPAVMMLGPAPTVARCLRMLRELVRPRGYL